MTITSAGVKRQERLGAPELVAPERCRTGPLVERDVRHIDGSGASQRRTERAADPAFWAMASVSSGALFGGILSI